MRALAALLFLAPLLADAGEVGDFMPQIVTVRADSGTFRFDCNVTGLDLFPGAYAMRLSCFQFPDVLPVSVEPIDTSTPIEWQARASFYPGGQPLTFPACRLIGYEFHQRGITGELDCRTGSGAFSDGFEGAWR